MTAPKPEVLPDGTILSDADADKILAALKPSKPRKIVKWKSVAKATDEKLHTLYRERDAGLVALTKMERQAGRFQVAAIVGWLLFFAMIAARAWK